MKCKTECKQDQATPARLPRFRGGQSKDDSLISLNSRIDCLHHAVIDKSWTEIITLMTSCEWRRRVAFYGDSVMLTLNIIIISLLLTKNLNDQFNKQKIAVTLEVNSYLEAAEAAATREGDVADVRRAGGWLRFVDYESSVLQVAAFLHLHLPKLLQRFHHVYYKINRN